jgi:hypothetical protein
MLDLPEANALAYFAPVSEIADCNEGKAEVFIHGKFFEESRD